MKIIVIEPYLLVLEVDHMLIRSFEDQILQSTFTSMVSDTQISDQHLINFWYHKIRQWAEELFSTQNLLLYTYTSKEIFWKERGMVGAPKYKEWERKAVSYTFVLLVLNVVWVNSEDESTCSIILLSSQHNKSTER